MQADWSVACGADDPVVVVPWSEMTGHASGHASGDASGSLRYVDLRKTPTAIDQITEASQYPSLAAALTRWNQPDAPLFTAKCDVWSFALEDFAPEDLPGFTHAQASYVDLVSDKPAVYSSFTASERQLRVWTADAGRIEIMEGRCECTLRPARILTGIEENTEASAWQSGFATTLYVWGYGVSPGAAAVAWGSALEALIEPVLRLIAS